MCTSQQWFTHVYNAIYNVDAYMLVYCKHIVSSLLYSAVNYLSKGDSKLLFAFEAYCTGVGKDFRYEK